jgi:hypothetical protein
MMYFGVKDSRARMSSTRRPLTIASGSVRPSRSRRRSTVAGTRAVVRPRDDRRERSVEVESEQGTPRDRGDQRRLALGREQVSHAHPLRWL